MSKRISETVTQKSANHLMVKKSFLCSLHLRSLYLGKQVAGGRNPASSPRHSRVGRNPGMFPRKWETRTKKDSSRYFWIPVPATCYPLPACVSTSFAHTCFHRDDKRIGLGSCLRRNDG